MAGCIVKFGNAENFRGMCHVLESDFAFVKYRVHTENCRFDVAVSFDIFRNDFDEEDVKLETVEIEHENIIQTYSTEEVHEFAMDFLAHIKPVLPRYMSPGQ